MARPSSRSGEWARASVAPQEPCTATVDERGIVTGWSEGAGRLLGYGPAEVVGHPAARLVADDVEERVRRVAAGRRGWSGSAVLRHRDGRQLPRRLLAHRRASGGAAAEWLVVAGAAGGPSSPGEDLPKDGLLGEWVLRQLPCSVGVFDRELRLVAANAGLEGALSLSAEEMHGWRLAELAPHPLSDRAEAAMRLVLEGGGVQHVADVLGPGGVGAEGGWPASLAPLKDAEGRVRAVCLVAYHTTGGDPARQRMLLQALPRIGTTEDAERTAQELAEVAVPAVADYVAVEVLDAFRRSGEADPVLSAESAGRAVLSRVAVRSVLDDGGVRVTPGESVRYPALSPVTRCLVEGQAAVYGVGEPAVARWAEEDPQAAWIGRARVHSVMVVPLRAQGGGMLGAVLLGRHRRREPFDTDDKWLAEQLAGAAAEGIRRARQRGRERTTTMTLQRSLLPQTLPDQHALDVATRYLPAGGRAGVGGDWFDVIPLSGARVALVVGDVVGHGVRAAATMGRVRTAVRTLADVDLPPDELLTHLDDLVVHLSAEEAGPQEAQEGAAGIGTTCLYAVYDPISRRLALARAGHPPPAVVAPDGAVRFLDVPPGPPLGLGGLPFETVETELAEGSLIALYTDGLLEARDHDIDEALDKMFATLARPAPTPDTVCDRLLAAMLTHPPDDDIALLAARTRCLGADRVATWELDFEPTVVARARRLAADQLAAWQLDEAGFITELVVSELVTNALRYGRRPVRLRLIHEGRTLISEVFDSSSTAPHLRRARVFDEGGRGLLLVGQLAQRWGTRHEPTGKTVWAEQFLNSA
ncbi:SpoIIE family protein phosphatase [Streptomyces muensis]|uniref:SpoIIE family protein phosphatase n=1 Tax=Streptomyces muensis TaxID=1077944 RepID=A0A9X1TMR8_STRM4|nr:SpoIIE family protein phosphatase [Streptomyces muensis]MCF1596380.1 SpoIIE family protein phosphatase [Streptomyces muensis]